MLDVLSAVATMISVLTVGSVFRMLLWIDDRRIARAVARGPRLTFGIPPKRRPMLEPTFDGWIAAETDQTFGEWIEAIEQSEKRRQIALKLAMARCGIPTRVDTGTLRASLPRLPTGGTAEVWPMKPTFPPNRVTR